MDVPSGTPVELFLVLEGERAGGLPVYCSAASDLRIAGRAVPKRMLVTPERAGLAGAEIRWQALRPADDARGWIRHRLEAWTGRWSLDLAEFPDEVEPGAPPRLGTLRFAAAIALPGPTPRTIGSKGWSVPGAVHPDDAPGFRVTRFLGQTLLGRAEGLARLPVVPELPASFARNKVALAPIDLFVAPYEDLGQVSLEPLRSEPLDDEAWSWLLEPALDGVRRRSIPGAALVGPRGRGVRWGADVQTGDVLVVGGRPAILQTDDGDGWLGEGDKILHTTTGRVTSGPLFEAPGPLRVLRPRLFMTWRQRLESAGYGELGQLANFSANLAQACREFQHDQGLPETGFPDAATAEALDALLGAMDAAAATASGR